MKYEPKLGKLFELFARDSADAKVASKKYGAQAGGESMNLGELMTTLKDARVLDDRCTAREVTTFFVLVNIDDELYANARGSGDSSAELTFDEFWEISVRICNEQVPSDTRGETPFEISLDAWIGLNYLPRLEALGKKRRGK
jgi:hypothetical protein